MKSIKIAGLCLVAVFAVSMVASGSASAALPEIAQCRNVGAGNGHWKDSQCSEKEAGGAWTTKAGGSLKDETFSSVSGLGKLKSAGGTIECKKDTNEGEITDGKHVLATIHFHECEEPIFKLPCNTPNAGAGQINTARLKGWVIYIGLPAEKKIGIFFEPNAGTEFTAGEIECGAIKTKVTGCIAGEFTKPKPNVFSTTAELAFTESGGKQNPNKITYEEKEKSCFLTAFGKEAVLTTTDTLTFQFDTAIIA